MRVRSTHYSILVHVNDTPMETTLFWLSLSMMAVLQYTSIGKIRCWTQMRKHRALYSCLYDEEGYEDLSGGNAPRAADRTRAQGR